MSDNSTVFDGKIGEIKQDWRITKSQIETDFDEDINRNINNNTIYDENGFIRINDYKDILGIEDNGDYTGGDLKVLKNIVDVSLVDLKTEIDNRNYNLSNNNKVSDSNTDTDIIDAYKENKKFYTENKDKIHGAIIQAKTQNENYNNLISTSINLICGILIVSYLIYKIYSPITVSEIQNAVKTTTDTAKNVAEQAQSSTSKIISGK
jgi:hypothetical protein